MTTMVVEPPRQSTTTRFLTPDDCEWTDDGAATWLTGRTGGLTYSFTDPANRDTHLVLHNRGGHDLAVLSMPGFAGTADTRFSLLPSGSSVALPDVEFHIVQGERRDGRPVLVGQIVDDDEPVVLLHAPRPGDVEWSQMSGVDGFWTPSSPPPGGPMRDDDERLTGADFGVECADSWESMVVHNHGTYRIAVLMTGLGGAYDLVVAMPGESVPIPPGPGIHYVQVARRSGHPVVVEVLRIAPTRATTDQAGAVGLRLG